MLLKLIALSVVFGLVVAESHNHEHQQVRQERHIPIFEELIHSVAAKPDISSAILDIITAVIGYKTSAISIAVNVIDWLLSHALIILVGGISTLALCKFTDKCSPLYTSYEDFVPLTPLRELVTPERLETAEKFLVTAVAKYAEEKRGIL